MDSTKKSTTWGGRRPNAGRKKTSTYISARIPLGVFDEVKAAADDEGVSLSAKVAEVLAEWTKTRKQ